MLFFLLKLNLLGLRGLFPKAIAECLVGFQLAFFTLKHAKLEN